MKWPNFEILRPPNKFSRKRAIRMKFGTDIEDGPLRTDHKTTHKWAWPGSRDLISQFCDPLNNFWTNERSASNIVERWRTDPSSRWNIKQPLCGPGLGHVTQFRNFGTPNNFWRKIAICFKFGIDIEDGPSLCTEYKTTRKWAWPRSRDPILTFWDTLITFERKGSYPLEIWYRHRGRTLPAYGL